MDAQKLTELVADFYVSSHDFNGMSVQRILELEGPTAVDSIRALVKNGVLEVVSSEWEENPHIKRFPSQPISRQLRSLAAPDKHLICVYPSPGCLKENIDTSTETDRPFTFRLRLGEPQLQPVFFDLAVLERYHNDPRYVFDWSSVGGHITIASEHYESEQMHERDKVLLQSFGLGRTARDERVVVVFLRYLSNLSPEHQKHWKGHDVQGKCKIQRDYLRSSLFGQWPEGVSIYEALLEELFHINKMCGLMGLPPLFRENFRGSRPRGFNVILRPTLRNFSEFVALLDKMMSENLNRDFFKSSGMQLDEEIVLGNAKIEVRPKGTLRLLDQWLRNRIRAKDPAVFDEIVGSLQEVRRLRQKPAHAIQEDAFDPQYHQLQEDLIVQLYRSVCGIRLLFSKHPATKNYEIPDWLSPDKISID